MTRDDFIRESMRNLEPDGAQPKHRLLFRMSDLSQRRGLGALRDALLSILPLAVISTLLYLTIAIADIFAKPDLIASITTPPVSGEGFDPATFMSRPYIAPYLMLCSLLPVFFAIAFTYHLARNYRSGDALPLSLISGAATFIALYSPLFASGVGEKSILEFPFSILEEHPGFLTGGVFLAIFVALINYALYRFLAGKGAVSPLPINVSESLQGAFRVVLPGIITVFVVIGLVLATGEPFGHHLYYSVFWMTKGASSIYALLVIVILVNIFAFFGIQGASSVYSIFWVLLLSGSIDPPMWGESSIQGDFGTLSTIFFFVMIGGTGSTLSLNLVMLRARSEQIKRLGNMTFIPSLMNANDLIIYGLPLAFNRYLIVPFFLVPLVNLAITYAAFSFNMIPAPELLLPPYLPAPLGAFLACGANWMALVFCVVNILVGMAIYAFFLSPYDLKVREQEDIQDEESRPRRSPL